MFDSHVERSGLLPGEAETGPPNSRGLKLGAMAGTLTFFFAATAALKLGSLDLLTTRVDPVTGVPSRLLEPAMVALEAILAIWIASGRFRRGSALAVIGMGAGFCAYHVLGISMDAAPCGCLGPLADASAASQKLQHLLHCALGASICAGGMSIHARHVSH